MTIQNRVYRSMIQGLNEVSQFHRDPTVMPYQPDGGIHHYPQAPPVDDPFLFPYEGEPGVETDQFSPMQLPNPMNNRQTTPPNISSANQMKINKILGMG